MRASLPKKLGTAQERTQILQHNLPYDAFHAGARDEQQPRVRAQLMLHMAIGLSHEPIHPAALRSSAEFFSCGKGDIARKARCTQHAEDHAPPRIGSACMVNMLEIIAPFNDLRARERISLFHHPLKKRSPAVTS